MSNSAVTWGTLATRLASELGRLEESGRDVETAISALIEETRAAPPELQNMDLILQTIHDLKNFLCEISDTPGTETVDIDDGISCLKLDRVRTALSGGSVLCPDEQDVIF